MIVRPTTLLGMAIVDATPFVDHRGAFTRFFCERELGGVIGDRHIVQINHSRTAMAGAVRGLHYQRPPNAEIKLIRCVRGRVWDVAVDLRRGSPTFLRWHGEELSGENSRMVIVPEGFAHGYQALEDESELIYCSTAFYEPAAEGGVSCKDPRVTITWPLPVADLSTKDANHPPLQADFAGIAL